MADLAIMAAALFGGLLVMVGCIWVGRQTAPVDRTGFDVDALAEPSIDPEEWADDEDIEPGGFEGYVELKPPTTKGRFLGTLWSAYKHNLRQRKLARRGYVRWIRVKNGVWTDPAYIKPESWVGSPFPIHRHDGGKYYFPRKAGVVDEGTGIRTYVHREGEAEPVNLDESEAEVLDPKDLKQAEEMEVATAPPSLFDRLDLDLTPQTLLAGGIGLTMVLAVIGGFL